MARNVLYRPPEHFLFEKARSTMPMHNDRRRRHGGRQRYSELDWFAEDPWAEPDLVALEADGEDEWLGGLWETTEDDQAWESDDAADPWSEDPYDGWGPVRRRRKRSSDRP